MDDAKIAIIEKIAKLLNLANDQDGTPEGENAIAMASKLMAKHRIEMSEVSIKENSGIDQGILQGYADKGGWRQWILDISSALSDTFDTKCTFDSYSFELNFYGDKDDVETCLEFLDILQHHVDFYGWQAYPNERNWRMRNQFGEGATTIIKDRLYKIKSAMHREFNENCRDLVVCKKQKIEKWMEENVVSKKSKRKDTNLTSRKAFMDGVKAGETAPIGRGVDEQQKIS